jgi:hypothetical protein
LAPGLPFTRSIPVSTKVCLIAVNLNKNII